MAHSMIIRERERDRQTDRQTDRDRVSKYWKKVKRERAVSYTHLTLPTNHRV